MKWFKFVVVTFVWLLLVWGGNNSFASFPPFVKIFDPFHGFWNNGEISENKEEVLSLPSLQEKVTILWDKRNIPHIFAKNNHDLYLAQGYITAKHRLWQMDFTTYVASGRLCEILGKRALRLDIENRSIGLVYGAKNAVAELKKHPEINNVINAYCKGVNSYINSLSYATYPIEYKILNYKPETWTPLKIFLIQKYMAKVLSYRSSDREMSNLVSDFKIDALNDLFPLKNSTDPIIPPEKNWNFTPVSNKNKSAFYTNEAHEVLYPNTSKLQKGSNNWAVSGKRTASGKPMLSNDPHLRLSMPSIWYESQLINNEVNVYGVTIPGIPGIVIGFNKDVSWGVTNQPWDSVDWYKITFKDEKQEHYKFDGKWLKTSREHQNIKIRGKKDYEFDLIYTHHGPVVPSNSFPLALRWVAHDASLEFKTFFLLNRAKNYNDYREALKHYSCPAQNFIFADVNGDIAISPSGKFPIKPNGLGRTIEDGATSKSQWKKYIPFEHKPFVKNPKLNYVSSANQHPTNKEYPYYYNGRFEYYRNVRINTRLAKMKKATVDDFNDLLNDNLNVHASTILPTLLKMLDKSKLSESQKQEVELIEKWNYFNDAEKIEPSIFEEWWKHLFSAIWDEFSDRKKYKRPSWHRTVDLIVNEPNSKWVDNVETKKVETIQELVNISFIAASDKLTKKYNSLFLEKNKENSKWQWGAHKHSYIKHSLSSSFSKHNLFIGGGRHIVNANSRGAGPSWRMVIEMTTPIKAWGVYPGGQSGNPGSKHYDDFVPHWSKGKLYKLHYLLNMQDQENIVRTSIMEAK